ncbi:MAG TPA: phytanoyl-CoA dioxygenase family protein [Allosphingosinicella sp.]
MPAPAFHADRLSLESDGAEHFPAALGAAELEALDRASTLAPGKPGRRLEPGMGLRALLGGPDAIAASLLGPAARPVRAMLLDKNRGRNWALGWHQDRTIALRARRPVHGFGAWTVKAGIVHAEPPFPLLERMLTLRVHLDPAGPDNAPLMIVPGSHRLGRIAEPDIPGIAERHEPFACLADAGDIWAYASTILHASERASAPARRRVLQLSYSADDLPGGLEWLGV